MVSGPLVSKGKREAFLCGELEPRSAEGGADSALAPSNAGRVPGRVRAMRLDRDASESNGAWDELPKGALIQVAPGLDPARPRIGKDAIVRELELSFAHEPAPSD